MAAGLDFWAITACAEARWVPRFGDATLAGWITVAAYAVCAILARAVMLRLPPGGSRRFWSIVTLVMVVLCINKQLDLQILLTAVGRCVAKAQGWYQDRRSFQREFIIVLLAVTAALFAAALFAMRRQLRQNGLALLGLAAVAGFVAVRAVSFHHMDALLNQRFLDIRSGFMFENTGLALIAVNALALLSRRTGPV